MKFIFKFTQDELLLCLQISKHIYDDIDDNTYTILKILNVSHY